MYPAKCLVATVHQSLNYIYLIVRVKRQTTYIVHFSENMKACLYSRTVLYNTQYRNSFKIQDCRINM